MKHSVKSEKCFTGGSIFHGRVDRKKRNAAHLFFLQRTNLSKAFVCPNSSVTLHLAVSSGTNPHAILNTSSAVRQIQAFASSNLSRKLCWVIVERLQRCKVSTINFLLHWLIPIAIYCHNYYSYTHVTMCSSSDVHTHVHTRQKIVNTFYLSWIMKLLDVYIL